MRSSLRDRYRLGLQKLADGSASNNAGGSPAGKSGIKGVDSEQDSGQARGEKGNKEQDTEAPEDGGNVGLEPTHSKEPRDIRQVFEHVNASIESQSEEAAEPGTPPLPVVLPPMIPEDNDIVGAPGALIATIPGARDIFNQYTAAGTPPEQAVLEVLDELHLSGKSQELTTAQQYLAKQVADMLGWQEPGPAPQPGEPAPGDPQAPPGQEGQEGQPAAAAPAKEPVEKIIKKETIRERPVLKKPEAGKGGPEKVSFDVDALLKVAHDRVQEMDDLHYRLLKETPVWDGPDRGVAYGRYLKMGAEKLDKENKDYHRTQNLFLAETMGGLGTAMAGPRVARATHQGVLNLKSLRLARPRIRAEKEIADINKGMASAHGMPFDQARKHVKKLLSERAIPENKLALIQRKLDALKKSRQSLRPKAYTLGGKKMFSAGRYGALAPAGLLAALHGAAGLAATNDAKKDREHVRALQSTSKSMKDLARVQRLRYEREQKLK